MSQNGDAAQDGARADSGDESLGGWSLTFSDSESSDSEPSDSNDSVAGGSSSESAGGELDRPLSGNDDDAGEGMEPAPYIHGALFTFMHSNPGRFPEPSARFPFNSVASLLERFPYPGPDEKAVIFNVPPAISHSLFLATFFGSLATSFPEARPAGVLVGVSPRQHASTTQLLAQLCYQLLAGSGQPSDATSIPPDLDYDLRSALQGHDLDFTEAVLWAALKCLLTTDGPNQQRIIVLGFTEYASFSSEIFSVVRRLAEFVKSTERRLKLLVVQPHGTGENIKGAHLTEVFLGTEEVRPAVLADFDNWIDRLFDSRPALQDLKFKIMSTVTRCYDAHHDSLLPIAYLSTLDVRPGLSIRQLDVDRNLLLGSDRFGWLESTMAQVSAPASDHIPGAAAYPSAHTLLSLVRVSARPLTTQELAAALSVVDSAPDSGGISNDMPLDIEYDLRVWLAGLVSEEGGYLRPSHPVLGHYLDNGNPDQVFTTTIPSVGAGTHMDMAICCLRYMRYWGRSNPSAAIGEYNTSASSWPFLDYAVRFWLWHYDQGVSESSENVAISPLLEDWDLVKFWMTMWSRTHYLAMEDTVSALDHKSLLRPNLLSTTFNVGLSDSFRIALVAAQVLSIADGDEELAVLWALWCSEGGSEDDDGKNSQRDSWKHQLTSCPSRLPILLKLFPRAPIRTFQLLGTSPQFVAENIDRLLPTAIRQGISSIVYDCLGPPNIGDGLILQLNLRSVDDDLILKLPWTSCARNGDTALLEKLASRWPREATSEKNELGSALLCDAVRYGNLEVVDMILGWEFELNNNPTDSTDAVLVGAEMGFAEIMRHIKNKHPGILAETKALHAACNMGFVGVTDVLTIGLDPAVIVSQNEDGNTPLHLAVLNGHVDIVLLLLDFRKSILSQTSSSHLDSGPASQSASNSANVDPLLLPNGSDFTPLELAAVCERQTILSLLLDQDPPPSVDLSCLLRIAADHGRSEVVRDLLKREGINCNAASETDERTALHIASSCGHIDVVKYLVAHKVHVWAEDCDGDTALDAAVIDGNEDVVRVLLAESPSQKHLDSALDRGGIVRNVAIMTQLLNAGADIHHLRPNERTLLHSAAYGGQADALGILLMRRASIEAEDGWGDTPLADACSQGFVEIARMLLEAGASLTTANSNGLTPFQQAALGGHEAVVKLLLEWDSRPSLDLSDDRSLIESLIDSKHTSTIATILSDADPDVLTPALLSKLAHYALRADDTATLTSLLCMDGVDLDTESAKAGFATALQECAYHGNLKMAKALIANQPGVDVNKQQGRYHTALIASVCRGEKPGKAQYSRRCKMIRFLKDDGAYLAARGGWYGTMLNAAAACASANILTFLIDDKDVKLPVRWIDTQGRGVVHMACVSLYEPEKKLDYLRKKSKTVASVLRTDKQGRTPLHFACGQGNLAAVRFLVKSKLWKQDHVEVPDKDGWTPLHWACRQRNAEVVRFLVHELGADTAAKTRDDWTAGDVAVFHGHQGLVEALWVDEAEPEAAGKERVQESKEESGEANVDERKGGLVAGEGVLGAGKGIPNEEVLAGDGNTGGDGEGDTAVEEKPGAGDKMDLGEGTPLKKPVPTGPGVKHDETCFSCFIPRSLHFAPEEAECGEQDGTANQPCDVCAETNPIAHIAHLPCNHRYCPRCIGRLFTDAFKVEALFPPRCCQLPIPVEITNLADGFIDKFYKKQREYGTINRTYCSKIGCAAFIPPESIVGTLAQCGECGMRTCSICKRRLHRGRCIGSIAETQKRRFATGETENADVNAGGVAAATDKGSEEWEVIEAPAECGHDECQKINRRGRHQCGNCDAKLAIYIFRCRECRMFLCAMCKNNRL